MAGTSALGSTVTLTKLRYSYVILLEADVF